MNRKKAAGLAGSCGLGALVAFGALSVFLVGNGAPLAADSGLLAWSVDHRPHTAVAFARAITATGTGVIPYLLAVLAGIVAGRTTGHRMHAAGLAVFCLVSGQAVRYGLMTLLARPRPPRTNWQTHASGWAFPSGHTTTAALAAGLLVLAICLRAPHGTTPLVVTAGCWGALVGLTRAYLGVHWFTDVIGGWLLSIGWLSLFLYAAARRLPDRFLAGTTLTAHGPTEDPHAPQDPGR
ncbi:phosphatase PAP2 family protein [Streptomyces sp. A5-4]|uniref:phosphatase PAP2 family protein n=1 Tax=Streptomyces sp. A5-4 TaxID=3384771 RepID=UPI003DA90856